MKQRGRKSTASLSVVRIEIAPMEAPDELSSTEKLLFDEIVATKPADYFNNENGGLLIELVRARDASNKLSVMLNTAKADDIIKSEGTQGLSRLLGMREKQARLIASLMTKLRLTPQSKYQAKDAARIPVAQPNLPKPWATAKR